MRDGGRDERRGEAAGPVTFRVLWQETDGLQRMDGAPSAREAPLFVIAPGGANDRIDRRATMDSAAQAPAGSVPPLRPSPEYRRRFHAVFAPAARVGPGRASLIASGTSEG